MLSSIALSNGGIWITVIGAESCMEALSNGRCRIRSALMNKQWVVRFPEGATQH